MPQRGDLQRAWRTLRRGPVDAGYTAFRVLRERRGLGLGRGELSESDARALSGLYDLTAAQLAAHQRVVEAQLARGGTEISTLLWFLPHFSNPHGGGMRTILRLASHAAQRHGARSTFCVYNGQPEHVPALRARLAAAFPALADAPVLTPARGSSELPALPPVDAAIGTFWTSAYPLARYNDTLAKLYLVQDFEPDFYAAGSASALAEETYRLGIPGIVNTPRLAEAYRAYGAPAVSFLPAVDEAYLAPRPARAGDGPVRIVFYGRPSTPRNAFGLGLAALRLVKQRYGERVEIVAAGEPWAPGELGVEGVVENRGRLGSLEEIADLYRSCDVGLALMLTRHPSYQPFEFLASGVAPVSNRNPDTAWMLRDGENCLLARPLPSLLADQVGRLVENPGLRARLVEAGRAEVAGISWGDQLEKVWNAMTSGGFEG